MSKGDSDKKLMVNMYDIKDDKDTNLLPGNIRKNTKILGVTGTLDPQADESDATATSSDIALNKSAYVNNEKIYGSVVTTDDGLDTLQTTITNPNVTYSQGKINIESPVTTNQNMLIRQNSQVHVEGSIDQSIIANKANITGDKIIEGNTILGVAGTVENKGDVNISTAESTDTTIGAGYYDSITSPALEKDSSYRNAQKLAGLILEGVTLPTAYEQLEYLESTGTQYIDLDFPTTLGSGISDANYDFLLDTQFTELDMRSSGSKYHLQGVGAKGSGISIYKAMLYVGWYENDGNPIWCYSNADSNDYNLTNQPADLNRHKFLVNSSTIPISTSGNGGLYIDGTRVDSHNPTLTKCRYDWHFTLFGYENSSSFYVTKCRIYRFTLGWYLENPYVDVVPVRRKSDGVLGMYDIIRNRFFTNAGTGTFLYGEF